MKTKIEGKNRGSFALLENVSPNLFRHRENQSYWGAKKVNGRRAVHALEAADRKTADGKLAEWLGDLKKVSPGNRDMTLAMLLERYEAARTDLAHSTLVGERGRIAKFRDLFPRPMDTLVARVLNSDIAAWVGAVGKGKRPSTRSVPSVRSRSIRFRGVRYRYREESIRPEDHSEGEKRTHHPAHSLARRV